MKSVKLFFFILMLVFGLSRNSVAQLWSGILAPSRATDWSNAGIAGGIPNRTTQCGSTIAAYNGAGTTISNAISSCAGSGGGVVQLGAGTFNLSSGITFFGESNVTLRGAGADQTLLVFTGNNGCNGLLSAICMEGNSSLYGGGSGLNPDNTATWTATSYAKGQTQVTLSAVTNLQVGNPMVLDQCNDGYTGTGCSGTPVDTGNIYICSDSKGTAPNKCNDDSGGTGGSSGAQRNGRDQFQMVTVTNISGKVVTFTPGLYMPNWRSAQSPGAYWSSAPTKLNGVEDLSMDFTRASSQSGITVWNCSSCWVKGIRSAYTTHNNAGQRNHIWIVLSPHVVVRDNYFFGSGSLHSEGYGVEVFGTSDSLIENNIFQNMPSPQMLNGPCSGCVVGYNYSINDANDASFLFNSYTLHSGGLDNTLAEGNIGNSFRGDLFHGTHHFATAFRNYWNGWETGISGGLIPAYLDPFSRYFNLVGNVLGRTGVQSNYQETPSGGSGNSIYVIGTGTANVKLGGDQLTVDSLMRWGNYDTLNAAVRFVSSEVPSTFSDTTGAPSAYANPVPSNTNLPSSFYLSSKPSWWPAAKPWPPIGPDVTGGNIAGVGGHANTIPAQDCYATVMGGPADGSGSVLSFNADICYSQTVVDPPTGLNAVVH
jgi:hypothetical protein